MFRIWKKEPERPNYAKIFAVTLAVVAGVCAAAYVIFKLFNKYFCLTDTECDDYLDECCDDCVVCIEDEPDCEELGE